MTNNKNTDRDRPTADGSPGPKKKDVLRDPNHSFDGIQEYDNDMPRWWVNLFILTIIFGALYLAWYHLPFFPSNTLAASFEQDMAAHKQTYAAPAPTDGATPAAAAGSGGNPPITWASLRDDAQLVAEGKTVFDANCVPCHGPQGGGLVGPNLTDDFWIHETDYPNLLRIVTEGVAEKGMPPWGPVIGPQASKASLAYIATLRGTNPPNAKAPEGLSLIHI